MKHIILASASDRRKNILKQLGLPFDVIPSDYEEDMSLNLPPVKLITYLSREKARVVAQKYPDSLVIGADTFICLGNRIFAKPYTAEKAKEALRRLNGKTHEVLTGLTLINGPKEATEVETTKVTFRKLTDEDIERYIEKEMPLQFAGSYKIQELGAALVEKIEGDYFNILGIPVNRLVPMLKTFGIHIP